MELSKNTKKIIKKNFEQFCRHELFNLLKTINEDDLKYFENSFERGMDDLIFEQIKPTNTIKIFEYYLKLKQQYFNIKVLQK